MNVLRRTSEEIETRGWITGDLTDEEGRVCLLGGLGAALGQEPGSWPHEFDEESRSAALEALTVLSGVLLDNHGDLFGETPPILALNADADSDTDDVVDVAFIFNDRQDSPEPVIRMLEKAAAKLDEQI